MTFDQIILFTLLAAIFVLLIWGRWRYDLVAFGALIVAVITDVVPAGDAFSGFGHPATVIVALVLIVSRALTNSGVIELIGRHVVSASRSAASHIGLMAAVAASLSAIINNVAALAVLMPVDLEAATKAKRSPAKTLMPLSFASILGGMITLIGTPPNIIVAEFRNDVLGEPFSMFDFAPVGLICAGIGVLFIATIGWRLIPGERTRSGGQLESHDIGRYVAELRVPAEATIIGQRVAELGSLLEEEEASIIGMARRGRLLPGAARREVVRAEDVLIIEVESGAIDRLSGELGLEYVRREDSELDDSDLVLTEVVVPDGARIQGRSATSLQLLNRHDVTLLGVSRQGRPFREQVRKLQIKAGDVLLLLGPSDRLPEITNFLGCLPLAERGLEIVQRNKALLSIGIFATAVILAAFGIVYLPVSLAAAVALLVATGVVPLRQLYESVEWPIIVLLGSMIPIGVALEASCGTMLIASTIIDLFAGSSPVVILTVLMIVTMTLSDVINNTATAVIAAPIALNLANSLGVSPDPFLMCVAVAASCAFLTPIGHKNNTLILGPGGYHFRDYWRMGLPLEIIIIAVGVPAILWAWPL
ncbi:MAG: SLC13 family permease [Candidatus Rariloculaceae bacterium]